MRGAMPPNRQGGLAVDRYALLQRVGSTFINGTPAISVFFKPRMQGARYLKELSDRAVVTWTLTEPYAGIQDWTWTPTVNRFQAVLHADGVIDLTYDEVSARDGIVGIFPKLEGGEERPLATLTAETQGASGQQIKSIRLSAVEGVYLQARIEAGAPVPMSSDQSSTSPIFRVCLSATKPTQPCANDSSGATVWTAQRFRAFRQRPDAAGRGARYIGFGNGLSPDVNVEGSTITLKGTLPVGVRAGSQLYVSAAVEPSREESGETAQAWHMPAQSVRLESLGSPEMNLASIN
jgi:hypothetical protein